MSCSGETSNNKHEHKPSCTILKACQISEVLNLYSKKKCQGYTEK